MRETAMSTLNVSGDQFVSDPLTLSGVTAITLTELNSSLTFTANATLDDTTVTIGNSAFPGNELPFNNGLYGYNNDAVGAGSGVTLTLGPGTTVALGAGFGEITGFGTIINQGAIRLTDPSGGGLSISSATFTNQGRITVLSHNQLDVGFDESGIFASPTGNFTTTFTNTAAGVITVGPNAVLDLSNDTLGIFTNAGQINVGGAGALFDIQFGVLANTGTINVNGGGELEVDVNATLQGGTLIESGGSSVGGNGGTLDGVSLQGTMNVIGNLSVADGLTVSGVTGSGSGAIKLTTLGASLTYTTSGTLNNTTVTIGDSLDNPGNRFPLGNIFYGYNDDALGAAFNTVLTLGSTTVVYALGFGQLTGPGTIVNQGAIKVTDPSGGGQFLSISPTTFTNQGKVVVANGGQLDLGFDATGIFGSLTGNATTSFTNAASGVIAVGAGSSVNLRNNIDFHTFQFGLMTNAGQINVGGVGALFDIQLGTLTNTGTVNVAGGGELEIDGSATLQGGTLIESGGSSVGGNGTLDGVSLQGTMNVIGNLAVADGLTVSGVTGSGSGAINLTALGASLTYMTSGALNNATVTIGDSLDNPGNRFPLSNAFYSYNEDALGAASGAVLTLGPATTVNASGFGQLTGPGTIVNQGAIKVTAVGGQFLSISPTTFANQGKVVVANGGQLDIGFDLNGIFGSPTLNATTTFTNAASGVIAVGAGSTINLRNDMSGTFSNAGQINVGGVGALFDIQSGSLTSTGIFNIAAGGELELDDGATVHGGTLIVSGGGSVGGRIGGGTLDGVSVQGTMNVVGDLSVTNGLTMSGVTGTGSGAINLTSLGASLTYATNGSLNNATVTIGDGVDNPGSHFPFVNDFYYYNNDALGAASGAVLTLGSTTTVNAVGFGQLTGFGTIVNQGTIKVTAAGGQFLSISSAAFTNQGKITVADGGQLDIGFDLNGIFGSSTLNATMTFTNAAGGVIAVGTGAIVDLRTNGAGQLANAGQINVGGAGALFDIQSGPFLNTGTFNIAAGGELELDKGVTVLGGTLIETGGGSIGGSGGTLDGVSVQGTMNVVGDVAVADGLTLSGVTGLGSGAINLTALGGSLTYTTSATLASATVTIGNVSNPGNRFPFNSGSYSYDNDALGAASGAVLTLASTTMVNAEGFGELTGPGMIVNQGTIKVTDPSGGGQFLSISSATFTNQSKISVFNGSQLDIGFDLRGIFGLPTSSCMTSFTNAASGVIAVGAGSTIDLRNDFAGAFTNAGQINVSNKGAVFDIQSGNFTNNGTINVAGGLFRSEGAITGNGAIAIGSGGTAEVGVVNAGQTIAFSPGTGEGLVLDAPGDMQGTITGFASGDAIDLRNLVVTSDSYSGGVLTLFSGDAPIAALNIAGSFAQNAFALSSDNQGGTIVTLTSGVSGVRVTPVTPEFRRGLALFAQYRSSGGDHSAPSASTRTLSDMASRHIDLAPAH
jgi:hypothetical protein